MPPRRLGLSFRVKLAVTLLAPSIRPPILGSVDVATMRHAPSHSGDQSGCRFLHSVSLQRPVVIHLSHILASPGARRMAEIAGLQMDAACAFSGPVSLSYGRAISFRSAPPNCSANGCRFIVAAPLTTNSVGVVEPLELAAWCAGTPPSSLE